MFKHMFSVLVIIFNFQDLLRPFYNLNNHIKHHLYFNIVLYRTIKGCYYTLNQLNDKGVITCIVFT